MEPGILRGKGPGWYVGDTGELGNKDCTSLSFFSNLLVYSLAERSSWVSPPWEERAKIRRKETEIFLKDDEGTQGHKDEMKNVFSVLFPKLTPKPVQLASTNQNKEIKCISQLL